MPEFAWVARGLIKVPVVVDDVPARNDRDAFLAAFPQMIACPTCRAKVCQDCRTRAGRRRPDHVSRLLPKRCPCGDVTAFNRQLCDECRDAARRENARIGMRNTRARRRAA